MASPESFTDAQIDLSAAVEARQKLESQQQENATVKMVACQSPPNELAY